MPSATETAESATVCEHLHWRTITGTPKLQACGQLLERLEVVRAPAQAAQWRHAVARHQPLGERGGFGYRLRRFVVAGERVLGCLLLAGAARAIAVRDAARILVKVLARP